MTVFLARDGELADQSFLKANNFASSLNNRRDFRYRQFSDEAVYSFVGFVINDIGDSLVVLPKHFLCKDTNLDASMLFRVMSLHPQMHPDKYVGEENLHFESNYPFDSYFYVYNYYKKYGLYHEIEQQVSLNSSGRIDWKRTIQQSAKIPVDDTIVFLPIKYRATKNVATLITDCMAFVIAYTVSRFGFLLGGDFNFSAPATNLLNSREYIVGKLIEERNHSFLDNKIQLIDALIKFFSGVNEGGPYYLKHYSFEKIWESAVLSYLRTHFEGVRDGKMKLSDSPLTFSAFDKAHYALNTAKPDQTMEPDYYLLNDNFQCIFDAKYYSSMEEIDYKQLVYTMLLSHLTNPVSGEEYQMDTCSALILPSETRSSKLHFKIDDHQVHLEKSLEVYEERLPASDVLHYYESII